jgi:hypothetical protein
LSLALLITIKGADEALRALACSSEQWHLSAMREGERRAILKQGPIRNGEYAQLVHSFVERKR